MVEIEISEYHDGMLDEVNDELGEDYTMQELSTLVECAIHETYQDVKDQNDESDDHQSISNLGE